MSINSIILSEPEFLIQLNMLNKTNLNPESEIFESALELICKLYKVKAEETAVVKETLVHLITKRDAGLLVMTEPDSSKTLLTRLCKPMLASPIEPYIFCNAGCTRPERRIVENIKEIQAAVNQAAEIFAKQAGAMSICFDTHRTNDRIIKEAQEHGYVQGLFPNKWVIPNEGLYKEYKEYVMEMLLYQGVNETSCNELLEFYKKLHLGINEEVLEQNIRKSLASENSFFLGLKYDGQMLAVIPVNKSGELLFPDSYIMAEILFDQAVVKKSHLTITQIIGAAVAYINDEALKESCRIHLISYIDLRNHFQITEEYQLINNALYDLNFNSYGKVVEEAIYLRFAKRLDMAISRNF